MVNKTLKISFFLPDLRGGGAERVSLSLAKAFSERGHEVEFVLRRCQGDLLAEAEQRFRVYDLASPRVRGSLKPLIRYLDQNSPDVLIAAMWPLTVISSIAKCVYARRKSLTLLLVEHSVLSVQYKKRGFVHGLILRRSIAFALKVADHYVAVSSGVAADIANLSGANRKNISVIHNPVPECGTPSCDELEVAFRLWEAREERVFRILTVGSFKAAKNIPLLLRSFARVLKHVDAKLMILGDGPQRQHLERLIDTLGISDRIIMPGFQTDTSPFYRTADLFVLSSDREGLPTVLIEALSAGLPVVSTNCKTGPAEILGDGEFGTLVPVNDEIALSKAIVEGLLKQHDPNKLKVRARDFAPAIAAQKYLELIGVEESR